MSRFLSSNNGCLFSGVQSSFTKSGKRFFCWPVKIGGLFSPSVSSDTSDTSLRSIVVPPKTVTRLTRLNPALSHRQITESTLHRRIHNRASVRSRLLLRPARVSAFSKETYSLPASSSWSKNDQILLAILLILFLLLF